jgi:dihydrofolate reductase
MIKTTAYIAASVDGFIAREDGQLDWLPSDDTREDYGYQALMDSIDALVMGRKTYKTVLALGAWPYADKAVFVLSHSPLAIPLSLAPTVQSLRDSPQEILQHLASKGYQHLYIDGGQTIQSFLREGLLQELIITRVPILLGKGIPLFGELDQALALTHIETTVFTNGLVQSKYHLDAGEDADYRL